MLNYENCEDRDQGGNFYKLRKNAIRISLT